MFELTIEFDLLSQPDNVEKLKKSGDDVDDKTSSFTLVKKSNFVPRVGDTITHYTVKGHVELSGKVVLVNFLTDEDSEESFYILVDPKEAD